MIPFDPTDLKHLGNPPILPIKARNPMTEKDWTAAVLAHAKTAGWRRTHFRAALNAGGRWHTALSGDAGWPDLTAVHVRRRLFIVRELKTDAGKLDPDQVDWLLALYAAGIDVGVWRPSQLRDVLSFLYGRPAI